MDFNQIDLQPLKPGYGCIWQGGTVDQAIDTLPGPLLIVCMDAGEANDQWINHQNVEAVLAVWIDDSPTATLKDNVLLALYDSALAWLANGGNIYDHCAAGVSRSSYFDIGIHMRLMKWPYEQAYEYVKAQRPQVNPNSGFVAQLQRLESQLNS